MNAVKLAAKIAQYKYIFNPETRPMPAVANPARIPKVKAYFILSVFQAFKNKNNARNKKKNIADSFSGIPATVLDNKIGITIIKNVEIKEIIFFGRFIFFKNLFSEIFVFHNRRCKNNSISKINVALFIKEAEIKVTWPFPGKIDRSNLAEIHHEE